VDAKVKAGGSILSTVNQNKLIKLFIGGTILEK
jgi:hypothetical protein